MLNFPESILKHGLHKMKKPEASRLSFKEGLKEVLTRERYLGNLKNINDILLHKLWGYISVH